MLFNSCLLHRILCIKEKLTSYFTHGYKKVRLNMCKGWAFQFIVNMLGMFFFSTIGTHLKLVQKWRNFQPIASLGLSDLVILLDKNDVTFVPICVLQIGEMFSTVYLPLNYDTDNTIFVHYRYLLKVNTVF